MSAALVQNTLTTYLGAIMSGAVTQLIAPEFPLVGAALGAMAGAIVGYALGKLADATELIAFFTKKLSWIFTKIAEIDGHPFVIA